MALNVPVDLRFANFDSALAGVTKLKSEIASDANIPQPVKDYLAVDSSSVGNYVTNARADFVALQKQLADSQAQLASTLAQLSSAQAQLAQAPAAGTAPGATPGQDQSQVFISAPAAAGLALVAAVAGGGLGYYFRGTRKKLGAHEMGKTSRARRARAQKEEED